MRKIMRTDGRIFVHQPHDMKLLLGAKTIETAHINLPERFIGKWLDVQNAYRQSLGAVKFKRTFEYETLREFVMDEDLHQIYRGSPFHFNFRYRTFGWEVEDVHPYQRAIRMQPMRSMFRLELY